MVRRDPVTGLYVTLSNPTLNESYTDQRNVLVLCSSPDLRSWTIAGEGVGEGGRVGHDGGGGGGRGVLLLDDSGLALSPDDSVAFTGFHYVDWQFDGGSSGSAIRMPEWREIIMTPKKTADEKSMPMVSRHAGVRPKILFVSSSSDDIAEVAEMEAARLPNRPICGDDPDERDPLPSMRNPTRVTATWRS